MSEAPTTAHAALAIEDLSVAYVVRGVPRAVLRSVSFSIAPGESYGLVGESGCGKSTTAYAALRYLPANGRITGGKALIDGTDVTHLKTGELQRLRATRVSMVYQDPGAALNPSIRIGPQVEEAFTVLGHSDARSRALAALDHVRISDPRRVMARYPHQLSGGMQQRVVIAMALACDPQLLVLDEPTTGLDATVEAEVLDLIQALRTEMGAALLLIGHNLGVIRKMCDRVGVMYAGRLVEEGPAEAIFREPRHPYTVGLLRCVPRLGSRKEDHRLETIPGFLPQIGESLPACVFVDRCPIATEVCRTEPPPAVPVGQGRFSLCHHTDRIAAIPAPAAEASAPRAAQAVAPVLSLEGVSKTFKQAGHNVYALAGIDLELRAGETLGLVGESGSGKTTLAKTILGIHAPDEGGVMTLKGERLPGTVAERGREEKRSIQIVFQNPDSALNRSHTVRGILMRSLKKLAGLAGQAAEERLETLGQHVRLSSRHLDMRPRQLSGGLKQRVAIARAFAGSPRIVVCDEPTSALDVSVQAAILNLLADLQRDEGSSYVFISHDLNVVRYLSDRIAVLYLGRLMEVGPAATVFDPPHHPYTEALLSAVPRVDGEPTDRIRLEGEIPSAAAPPAGCVFHTRCPRRIPGLCDVDEPDLKEVEPGHLMRCHISVEELRRVQAKVVEPAEA
ncbi:MAG TPA: dipeptide ABC transporter ATP-binding protein [Gaiellales bacterium]|nr:dipeptide ABC transporter ATP-binding protein [Gaiellales bacterium]